MYEVLVKQRDGRMVVVCKASYTLALMVWDKFMRAGRLARIEYKA